MACPHRSPGIIVSAIERALRVGHRSPLTARSPHSFRESPMRILTLAALSLILTGCATSATGGGSAPVPDNTPTPTVSTGRVVTTSGSTVQMNTMNIDLDVKLFVTGTPDEAWAVLPGVYSELMIPVSVNDTRTKTIGNTGWKTRRSIGRVPAQRYLDCGSSGTLENAETYQLNLSIVTSVLPNPNGGAVISTAITGTGKNPITSSSAEVRCVSKGDLELRIRDMVQKAIYAK